MKIRLILCFSLMALGLAACGEAGDRANRSVGTLVPVPSEFSGRTNLLEADAATAGALVFKTNCEACHGTQGHGDGPAGVALDPAPQDLAALQKQAGDDYLYWRISTGREGTAMVAWSGVLSDEQIWQVIAFLRTLK